jgi:hypothetical protein
MSTPSGRSDWSILALTTTPSEEEADGPARGETMTTGPSSATAIAACLAFTTALMLAVIVAHESVAYSPVIVGLLATSLPALVAWLYADSSAWTGLEHIGRIVRWVVGVVAVATSFTGFILTVWSFSRLAVFLILLLIPLWYLALGLVSFLGEELDAEPPSDA